MTNPEHPSGCRPSPGMALAQRKSPVPAALGFALGVCLFFMGGGLPQDVRLELAVLAMAVFAWRWASVRPLLWLLLGLLWAQFRTCGLLCHPFPAELARADLRLEGRVASLPELKAGGTGFRFRVERTWQDERELDFTGLVRLTWGGAPPMRVGESRVLVARLKPPHGFANPGGFDYERWLFQQGILATGYVREGGDLGIKDSSAGPFWIDRWRQSLSERLSQPLEGSTAEGLVLALVLGEDTALTPAQWEVMTRTGVNHLVSISGLHVGLLAASLFFLTRWFWSRSPWLVSRLAAPRAGALGGLVAAMVYSALAGFAVATQRSMIMLGVVLVALLWSRTPRPWTALTFALAAVLLLDPTGVLSFGLWLSFGGVAALIYGLGNRLSLAGLWGRWGQAQWVVSLGFLPLLLLLFSRASVVSPLVNLVAIPLFGLLLPVVLIAALLFLIAGVSSPLIWSANLLAWLMDGLQAISAWPWAAISIAARPDWAWVAAFGGSLLLITPRGLPGRWLGLPLLLPLGLLAPPAPALGEAWLQLLDVGQGLSAVVRTTHHTLVFDTGPTFLGGFNTGEAVLVPYLREQGLNRIDTLILSHGDQDHAGGFAGLAGKVPIDRILAGESPEHRAGLRLESCLAGQGWNWDGVDFRVLHPPRAGLRGNDSSCVLRLATQGASLLLVGDLGQVPEKQLARHANLAATLLVAGHHGSNNSSSTEFLAAVAPSWVLYSSGFINRFGFPSLPVRERVAATGARELNTAETGAIGFVLTATGIDGPELFREVHPRLWSRRPQGER